ncbi:MAG TPA: S-methyl-5-thioribose-1-phosphate isomerase [Desulfomonilia bacterium]|nr:S-methyl-5-thioribose-1-phosphate isomerase [Desulfomonilia bacterium]
MIKPFCFKDGTFFILDQRRLPREETWIECTSSDQVAHAIRTLAVRGAPAIGIAAAYGLVLAARGGRGNVEKAAETLVNARPTAVNLAWAVRRCMAKALNAKDGDLVDALRQEADAIWNEEIAANESMSILGAGLFEQGRGYSVLTHCNAGSLATGGIGTAIGVIRKLHEQNKLKMVYTDETRPLLQGARITVYELMKDNIPCTLITDSMAGWLMNLGLIDAVIVGADRIARNHDAANKVGSYSLSVLAHAHGIPFYVAAPQSTFDPDTATGKDIRIEERDADEVLSFQGVQSAPQVKVFNPAFDVVPSALITAIISELKIYR